MSGLAAATGVAMCILIFCSFAQITPKGFRPFSVHDMVAMDRLSDQQPSPDGQRIVFVVRQTNLDKNKGHTGLWLMNADGSGLRRLTNHPEDDSQPRWSPDGKWVYFLSTRSGSSQVWRIAVDGGEAEPVTAQPLDIGAFALSPSGSHLLFSMEVFPDLATPEDTKKRLDEIAERKSTGRIYEQLMVRHWDKWKDGRRAHLFVLPTLPLGATPPKRSDKKDDVNAPSTTSAPAPVDLMRGLDADCPGKPFGGPEDFTFTPDGKAVVYSARNVGREEAWSTDFDLYVVPIDGSAPATCLTDDNPAWDAQPVFSPDGKWLAWRAMRVPGYESDRFRVMLKGWPDGPVKCLTESWDRSPGELAWSADSRSLFVTADNLGQVSLFAIDAVTGAVRMLVKEGHVRAPVAMGDRILYGMDHLKSPVDFYSVGADGKDVRRLTRFNQARLESVAMGEPEQFTFKGWNDEEVYAYVVTPADFDPGKKYPVAFLIHGGPQGSFGNDFHYRWNPQAYAGAGYGVVFVDFHGSTGYGQAFTDSIQSDWGGKPLVDLQKGLEAALKRYPWLDGERVAALGASYGGYMINWIAGNWPDRFRCLVNHDGVFDTRMGYFDTEELWFPERDHGGLPWERPELYEEHNPVNFVKNWKTPMLVIHGGLDFRVVETHGIAAFNALQRRGIPSRFLYFPNENHWVLKPANSILWHETVMGWLDQWCKEPTRQESELPPVRDR